MSNQFSSLSDFKASLVGNWDGNSPLLKTTWIVPLIRVFTVAVTTIVVAAINHCNNIIEAVRSTCHAPNIFKAGFCSAECVARQ